MAGEKFNLDSDENILSIKSPKRFVGGPYSVVYKNTEERWAIVAFDWDSKPSLGIRWFWGNSGNPFSRRPTWLVIPPNLINSTLNGLPLDYKFRDRLDQYLSEKIHGNDL
ncbi:MAG: hypothetical protein EOO91_01355 [Pedobacter sp.]|nr:MAG: hypothetical protein EOO91_01355 [Pedobacter sp.]